jgi:sensor histidine kinase YesM
MDFRNVSNQKIIRFLVHKEFRIYRHGLLLAWLFIVLIYGTTPDQSLKESGKIYPFIAVYFIFLIMIYFNTYILVPRFFLKARYIMYILLLVAMIFAGSKLFMLMVFLFFPEFIIDKVTINSKIIIAILIILYTTTIKLLQRWIKDSQRLSELRTVTYQFELNELKKQVTPHFLFNMLNNIKALIRINPIKATEVIIKLSDLLRYQIYESSEEKVPLASEVNFINNLLSLEKIRRDDFDFSVNLNFDVGDAKVWGIYSNLFIPFVENALKHSHKGTGSNIFIAVEFLYDGQELSFKCVNSYNGKDPVADKYGGLGLRNIRRRLELLYEKDQYHLEISAENKKYIVKLKLPL